MRELRAVPLPKGKAGVQWWAEEPEPAALPEAPGDLAQIAPTNSVLPDPATLDPNPAQEKDHAPAPEAPQEP